VEAERLEDSVPVAGLGVELGRVLWHLQRLGRFLLVGEGYGRCAH